MAAPAGTFQTHQAIGNREDLSSVIYDISPMEFPFMSRAPRVKAKSTLHEWQTDALAAPASNANIEGDDSAVNTAVPTVRLNNKCQIFKKTIQVSGTQDAMDPAGRDRESAYQLMKRGKEIKRDIERALTQNQGSSAGTATTARTLASTESWLFTNRTSKGTGSDQTTYGFSSGNVQAPFDSTATSSFTENDLKAMIQAAWSAGGNPSLVLVGPNCKKKISTFTGQATKYTETGSTSKTTKIIGAADVYVSDFGEHQIVPSRFCRDVTVQLLDLDYWAVAYLRGITKEKLAKTGDSDKWHIVTELTLESRQEAANSKITDVNGTL